jgi:hypothetical protein
MKIRPFRQKRKIMFMRIDRCLAGQHFISHWAKLFVVLAALAWAAQASATVPTYTGCYSASSGTINKLALGFSPQKPCNTGDLLVSFSAGDITKISVSGGLTGGGDNGDVSITLDPKYSLPQNCGLNQIPKIGATGWTCANDENTTYSAGHGLNLSSGTFSVSSGYQLPQSCSNGQVAKSDGTVWQCGTDNVGTTEVWNTYVDFKDGWSNNWDGAFAWIAGLSLPAGTFALSMTGLDVSDPSYGTQDMIIGCGIYMNKGSGNGGEPFISTSAIVEGFSNADNAPMNAPLSMSRVITLAAPATLDLECQAGAHQHVQDVSLIAIKVGTVHTQ